MHKWKVFITLKEGYKPVMSTESECELEFEIMARNYVTAQRMVKSLTDNLSNIEEYSIMEINNLCSFGEYLRSVHNLTFIEFIRLDDVKQDELKTEYEGWC